MVESSNCSSCIESVTIQSFQDQSTIPQSTIQAKFEVLPYRFKPETSDNESTGHAACGGKVDPSELEILSPEQVGNTDW